MAASDDELLDAASRDGSLDASKWPGLLEQVLKRLDHIVYNEFPIPVIPPPPPREADAEHDAAASETPRSPATQPTQPVGDSGDASTIVPRTSSPDVASRSTPPPPSSTVPASTPNVIPNSQPGPDTPARANETADGTLPAPVLAAYRDIQSSLRVSFATAPPFTIQRLAELVRRPKQHYRTLPAYLRALDRAVAVSSPSTVFPLPPVAMDTAGGESSSTYLAGGAPAANGMHDDFNAAALTRIPWLTEGGAHTNATANANSSASTNSADIGASTTAATMTGENGSTNGSGSAHQRTTELQTARTEQIDGPHGAGSVETVTVGSTAAATAAAHSSGSAGFVGFGAGGGGRAASQHKPEASSPSSTVHEPPPTTLRSNAEPLPALGDTETLRTPPSKRSRSTSPQPGTAAAAGATSGTPELTVTSPPKDEPSPQQQMLARGPEEIGMADMGPQTASAAKGHEHVFDAETAIGRPGEAETMPGSPTAMVRSPRPEPLPEPPELVMEDDDDGGEEKKEEEAEAEGEGEKMDVVKDEQEEGKGKGRK